MSDERLFIDAEKVDELSRGQFNDLSLYTDVRSELYAERAVPSIDFYQAALTSLGLEGRERILEVGCGRGGLETMLAKAGHGGEIVGTDIFSNTYYSTANLLKGYPNISFQQADARHLPYQDSSFERYVSMYNLYHIGNPEQAIMEAKRVTTSGGRLAIALRGHHNLERHALLVDEVVESFGFEAPGSPYLNFDSEDAPVILAKYFEIIPEQSYPEDLTKPLLRPMGLLAEDWPFYSLSIYGSAMAAIVLQLEPATDIAAENIPSLVRLKIDEMIRPRFENEIAERGIYLETAQDRLITCVNTK